jgi:hypothetical protein
VKNETVWDYDQRFKDVMGRLTFHIPIGQVIRRTNNEGAHKRWKEKRSGMQKHVDAQKEE